MAPVVLLRSRPVTLLPGRSARTRSLRAVSVVTHTDRTGFAMPSAIHTGVRRGVSSASEPGATVKRGGGGQGNMVRIDLLIHFNPI